MSAAPLTLVRTVDQAVIDRYAQASGDFNPIHVDPDYAATGPFGRTIAHGLMTLAYVADMLNRWSDGRFDEAGEIDVTFVGPVFVGDVVEISGVVEDRIERDSQQCQRIKLRVAAGERLILAGYAIHPDTKLGN
jgi:3-hydroxybutyryl-CoA dehydratase